MNTFSNVVALDCEYEIEGGEFNLNRGDLPKVLCMVAHVLDGNLQHVRTVKLWRGEFGPTPPFPIDDDTLVIGYSLWAEMTIFLTLGWKFPKHLFDLHTAYLAASNVLLPYEPEVPRSRARKDFATACHAYGLEGWEKIDKKEIAGDIGEGRWQLHGRDAIFAYCTEDVTMLVYLLQAMLKGHARKPPADVSKVLHWSNYAAKDIARIQAKGMPIDVALWYAVQENKQAVIRSLLRRFDPSHYTDVPIYDPDGHWSYARFENWLVLIGVTEWPRLETGRLDTDGDAFRLMSHIPGIPSLHVLKDSLNVIVHAKLPIGRDGRNRPSLFPFGTATGRNAHGKSLFNAHAAMRGFMVFGEDAPGFYLDWSQQEVILGAAQSRDLALIDAYRSGDIYHAFARTIGLTNDPDPNHWKKNDPDKIRDRMKILYLAIMYGMGINSIATSLQRHPIIAMELIELRKRLYPKFWQWREEQAAAAMLNRVIYSEFSWPLRISTSPKQRTLINFGCQANGAECLRLAASQLCEVGLVPSMLVHDAVLLELQDREQAIQAKEIMLAAGRKVCGVEIRVDGDEAPIRRYRDKRGTEMWDTIMFTLQEAGAIPPGSAP